MASIHERVVEFIQNVSTIINSQGRFIYGRELYSSFDYANNSKPNSSEGLSKPIISLLPFSVTRSTNPDSAFDSTSISLIFSRSADVADSAEREESILNEMAALAENFVTVIDENQTKPIQFHLNNVTMQPEYQFWMGTNSGYTLTFTLDVLQECNGDVPILVWILAGGVWNDSGVWDDNANWID